MVILNHGFGQTIIKLKVTQPEALEVFAGNDTEICPGETIQLGSNNTATGGTGNYLFNWNPTTGLSSSTVSNPEVTAIEDITYAVTVTDESGCFEIDTISIGVYNPIQVDLGDDVENTEPVTLNVGDGFVSYEWSDGSTEQTLLVEETGEYSVTVTDENGCETSDTVQVSIIVSINTNSIRLAKVYPNPANKVLFVELQKHTMLDLTSIKIYNCTGQLIVTKESELTKSSIDISMLKAGIYFVKVKNSIQFFNQKLIIE